MLWSSQGKLDERDRDGDGEVCVWQLVLHYSLTQTSFCNSPLFVSSSYGSLMEDFVSNTLLIVKVESNRKLWIIDK